MINNVVLVGRLVKNPELIETENNSKVIIELAIPRTFKNINGEYEIDNIECILWHAVADKTLEYCVKGDTVGIKGRLQNKNGKLEVIAERITFLANEGSN